MTAPELYVTNFNPNFTGVSATTAGVVRVQASQYDLRLVGNPLPDCPDPISKRNAFGLSKTPPEGRPFSIWHVRRNTEMRAAIWARDVLRRPIKIVFTSAAQRRHSAFPRWLISKMDAVIATTDRAAEFVPHVKAVVPHSVDTERFHPADDLAAAWAALGYGGTRGIATVGRIRPEKGTDRFVDAMLRALPQHPDVTALVIGKANDQSFLDGLKAKVAAAGLADRLLFIGEIDGNQMPNLIRSLTVLCALPRYEGYGMTPLEGMASGVPFVASDAGYFKAFSSQGKAGLVVDPKDAGATLVELLTDTSKLDDMSKQARSIAHSAYAIQTETDGIAAVYEELWSK